jgi:hypothetical protein
MIDITTYKLVTAAAATMTVSEEGQFPDIVLKL